MHAPREEWPVRLAELSDVPGLESLIPRSVHGLQADHYSPDQRAAALGPVFGVDRQLIRDRTYYVVEAHGTLAGAGGWSRRRSLYGGDQGRDTEDELLDPKRDAARIRAFFVHPDFARRGIGRSLLVACETALRAAGFRYAEIVATLPGERLYVSAGYDVVARRSIPLPQGLDLPVVCLRKDLTGAPRPS